MHDGDSADGESIKSYKEVKVRYDHPHIPTDFPLKEKTTKIREHPIKAALQKREKYNEKTLRCKQFKASMQSSTPISFTENTNKEKLILEHVKKYDFQFGIAYRTKR